MKNIERAYNDVRNELWELGLLADGRYLDEIGLVVSPLPRLLCGGAVGFIFDEGVSFLYRLGGFREGTIYIPRYVDKHPRMLRSVIRHEFAHAWAWLDGKFIRGRWFREAFGKPYFSEHKKVEIPDNFRRSEQYLTHASDYALTRPREDFAETFALFVKHRMDLGKFRSRPGLYRKLRAVERAVKRRGKTCKKRRLGASVHCNLHRNPSLCKWAYVSSRRIVTKDEKTSVDQILARVSALGSTWAKMP